MEETAFLPANVFQTHKSIQFLTLPLGSHHLLMQDVARSGSAWVPVNPFFHSSRTHLQSTQCIFCLDPEAGVNVPLVVCCLVGCCPGFCQDTNSPADSGPVTPPRNRTQAFWPMSSCYPKGGRKECSFS